MTEQEDRMSGPNLCWGDPVRTYEMEIVPGGCCLFYRAMQTNGGMLEVKIPMDTRALAEMIGLLNLLVLPDEFKPELPNVRISGHA